MRWTALIASLVLPLGACNTETTGEEASNVLVSAKAEPPTAQLPQCPFEKVHDLKGSIEGGRLLVTGRVDLMMAGFKPQLSERSAGSGVLALNLALVPEAQAAVSDTLRYERSGVANYPRGEIWCGGQRLQAFDMILVG